MFIDGKPADHVRHHEVWQDLAIVVHQMLLKDGQQFGMGVDERPDRSDSLRGHRGATCEVCR